MDVEGIVRADDCHLHRTGRAPDISSIPSLFDLDVIILAACVQDNPVIIIHHNMPFHGEIHNLILVEMKLLWLCCSIHILWRECLIGGWSKYDSPRVRDRIFVRTCIYVYIFFIYINCIN